MSFQIMPTDHFAVTVLSVERSGLSHRSDVTVHSELGPFIRFLHRSPQVSIQDTSPVSFIADTP